MMKTTRKLAAVAVGSFLIAGVAQAEVKFSGYVDGRMAWVKDSGSMFGLSEGAIKLSSEVGQGSMLLDLPITGDNRFSSTNVRLDGDQAQAYIAYKYNNGLSWKAGQFDSLFGAEANDSVDYRYTGNGAVDGLTPNTHTGLTVGYALSDSMGFTALVGATDGKGVLQSGDALNVGLLADFDLGMKVTAGVLFKNSTDNMLIDLRVMNHLGDNMEIGAEVVLGMAKGADTAVGIGLDGVYKLDKDLSVGVRPEYLMKANGYDSEIEVTVGPQYRMTEALRVKADYSLHQVTPAGGSGVSSHSAQVAAVYGF